jgi:uncharacterized Zn finger protein (UPF0148 family)
MSEDFDKEAEREKLRQQLERDEERRESTRQMSELLLQGATMTNAHCDTCGSPLFRQNGQTFCATCQSQDGQAAQQQGAHQQAAQQQTDQQDAVAQHDTRQAQGDSREAQQDPAQAQGAPQDTPQQPDGRQGDDQPAPGQRQRDAQDVTAVQPTRQPGQGQRGASASPEQGQHGDGGLGEQAGGQGVDTASGGGQQVPAGTAAADLQRTLSKFARAAAETDDPREARDHLEAAREAAETLAALRR